MMLFKLISAIALIGVSTSLLASAAAIAERKLPNGIESPIEGYAIVEPVFELDVLGMHHKLNGTAQEVYAQLEKIHGADKVAAELKHSASQGHVASEKRTKVFNPRCLPIAGQNWRIGDSYAMGVCSNALIALGKRLWYVDGRGCARMCTNGGIEAWVCNDRPWRIALNSDYLGSYVDDIRGICKLELGIKVTLAGGQLYDTDGYNVIARAA